MRRATGFKIFMKTELVDVSATRKELKVEIEADVVREAYDRISDKYAQMANVPGFRRGHAPRSVVRTRFKDEIRGEVLREIVPQAISDAIAQNDLQVIGEPDVHLDDETGLNKLGAEALTVHAHVEVLPEVELGEYKGLEAARRTRPVTDEDVNGVIQMMREQSAALEPVEDRGAQSGDIVTVNFQGKFVGDAEAEDINVDDVDVELGSEGVQAEFNENLTGVKADDERTFTVNYPEDFTSKGLAGKTVDYHAKVTAVRIKVLPELDDEWAKSLGEDDYDSLATLKEKIREDLEGRARYESDNQVRSEVMQKLVEAHPFEAPQSIVEAQANHRLETVVRDMMGRGFDPRNADIKWEGVRDSMMQQAELDVRGMMLLERIAEEENIEVTPEEIENEINQMAEASRQAVEQVRATLTKQGGERSIAPRLRNRKALDFLVANAKVTDEEWKEEKQESEVRSQESE